MRFTMQWSSLVLVNRVQHQIVVYQHNATLSNTTTKSATLDSATSKTAASNDGATTSAWSK